MFQPCIAFLEQLHTKVVAIGRQQGFYEFSAASLRLAVRLPAQRLKLIANLKSYVLNRRQVDGVVRPPRIE
ncbi:hypothetical protein AVDCRST_MAG81-933 [uncultured Synechococcales cyanobacterium]|uniref:Uncharacterized protein n=1 Tax=uncultured Synechococcales cyanobacterium TaxID=1936017 RepID=A0A6J4UZI1_9CYAN|nr:hypothetical protein AVDCRST_MAG81-933 [uncultured Synechococcales cyanobacterium]